MKRQIWPMLVILTLLVGILLCPGRAVEGQTVFLQEGETAVPLSTYQTAEIPEVYLVTDTLGRERIVQKVVTHGFIDLITLLVTIDPKEEKVQKVEVLQHKESDDYGGYLTAPWFLKRFAEKSVHQLLVMVKLINRNPNEVVAITGASKTSQAVINGVNLAISNFQLIKGGLKK